MNGVVLSSTDFSTVYEQGHRSTSDTVLSAVMRGTENSIQARRGRRRYGSAFYSLT